ncbi:MAG: hypothetical protein SOX77_05860 [Candidatus Borkfalkiaceae bacterium]|nr:hypothetical protein [Christensenellaceae bacterium]
MKKLISLTLTLLLCFCAVYSLTACGQNSAVGNYETYYVFDGKKLYKVGDLYLGSELKNDYVSAKVNNDHTLSVTRHDDGVTYTNEGTWAQQNDLLYLFDAGGGGYSAIVNDDFVYVYISGNFSICLKKQ